MSAKSVFNQISKVSSKENFLDPLSYFARQPTQPQTKPTSTLRNDDDVIENTLRNTSTPQQSPSRPVQVAKTVSSDQLAQITSHSTATVTQVANPNENIVKEGSQNAEELSHLTGEQTLMSIKDAYVQHSGKMIPVVLYMTNYRVRMIPSLMQLSALAESNPSIHSWLNVPLACIDRIEKEKKAKESRNSGVTFQIVCKDVRSHRITVQTKNNDDYLVDRAISTLAAYAFPNNMIHLFAFAHLLPTAIPMEALDPYDVLTEFSRQGVLEIGEECPWRICHANANYRLCNTYPRTLVMPRAMSDDELFAVAAFRSGKRLPVLCWGDRESGATIWRASQPKAGVSGSCPQDERFLEILAMSCTSTTRYYGISGSNSNVRATTTERILYIIDCRPMASAMANRAAGAGYESQTNYPNTRLEFFNIPNIHAMRDSLKSLVQVVLSSNSSTDLNFSKQVEDSQWLYYIRVILKTALDTAHIVHRGSPVLVHCSHGWDRTAQICALTQMFLDPYYRTIDGFRILVEKEWCSLGHPFQLRSAHSQDKSSRQDDQVSPIFLQFLDCVWQIYRQQPHYFEFNSRFILTLADHVYSGRFGNFLFNSDFDRDQAQSRKKTPDIWMYLNYNRQILTNPLYLDPNLENTPTAHVMLPSLTQLLRNVVLWNDYFLRWSPSNSILTAPEPLSRYLYSSSGTCLPSISDADARHSYLLSLSSSVQALVNSGSIDCTSDIEIPAMVVSEDYWEAAYRRERAKKEELCELSTTNGSTAGMIRSDNSPSLRPRNTTVKSMHTNVEVSDTSLVIDRLVDLLIKRGVDDQEIEAALLLKPREVHESKDDTVSSYLNDDSSNDVREVSDGDIPIVIYSDISEFEQSDSGKHTDLSSQYSVDDDKSLDYNEEGAGVVSV